ncbi:hypothetical protein ACFX13_039739 [Malus domestica]
MPQSNGTVLTETIAAAAVATLAIAGILLFLYRFLVARRCTKGKENGSLRRKEVEMNREEFRQCGGNVKGLIVSENGVVVINLRKLEAGQIDAISLKIIFGDELMENLFGYSTIKNQSSERKNHLPSASSKPNSCPNTSGLGAAALEKLTKISPSKEEEAKILQFNGNPSKLALTESFLYHILKAVPSAFTRFNAMLFIENYDPEVVHLKESFQTLEIGCKELRTRRLFLKLLEAILKAGNRGNTQGFNLSALLKLSDIKSTDGNAALLHFVVEQVAQSEGRGFVINQNRSFGRNSTRSKKPN